MGRRKKDAGQDEAQDRDGAPEPKKRPKKNKFEQVAGLQQTLPKPPPLGGGRPPAGRPQAGRPERPQPPAPAKSGEAKAPATAGEGTRARPSPARPALGTEDLGAKLDESMAEGRLTFGTWQEESALSHSPHMGDRAAASKRATPAGMKPLVVDPAELWDLPPLWGQALREWLTGYRSANTRRAYLQAWSNFRRTVGREPWAVEPCDVNAWAARLSQTRSAATARQYLIAVTGFYDFLVQRYRVMIDGQERALVARNPAHASGGGAGAGAGAGAGGVQAGGEAENAPATARYARARYLSEGALLALLSAIPRGTNRGRRDRALILTWLATGRPAADVVGIRWEALRRYADRAFCSFGPLNVPVELTPLAWEAILEYLERSGRMKFIEADDYLYIPPTTAVRRSDLANRDRLRRVLPADRPLSPRAAADIVRRYAEAAGIDGTLVQPSVIRNTAVALLHSQGLTPPAIAARSGYKDPRSVRAILKTLTPIECSAWQRLDDLLDSH